MGSADPFDVRMRGFRERVSLAKALETALAGAAPLGVASVTLEHACGRVLAEDFKGSMMGMPFVGHGMMGYDNVTARYWSTWNDNMSTGLMVSEGACDAQNACTFKGTWNDPVKKGPVTSRMTTRWTSPSTQVFEMHGPAPDGTEFKMMEITYTKKP